MKLPLPQICQFDVTLGAPCRISLPITVNITSLVQMRKRSFRGSAIFFQGDISVLKTKSYMRGKVYSICYYTATQAENEK